MVPIGLMGQKSHTPELDSAGKTLYSIKYEVLRNGEKFLHVMVVRRKFWLYQPTTSTVRSRPPPIPAMWTPSPCWWCCLLSLHSIQPEIWQEQFVPTR